MNWEQLQQVIRATDAQYASGNDAQRQAAVAAREAAVAQYQNYLSSYTPSSGGSTSGSAPTYSNPPSPAPPPPPVAPPMPSTFSVKTPEASLVQYSSDSLPQELLVDLLYEDVGGIELINIARQDTINGQNVAYSLVSNLSVINQTFNPNNILAGQIVYSSQLGQYALDISSKLPQENIAYLDSEGNLVIEFTSIGADELAEVEISANGTIYKIGV